jgi:SagB-type dehydrogenase family enzyme
VPADGGAALRAYHERTKHSVASLHADRYGLDWGNQPLPFKVYTDLDALPLPTELPGSQMLALDAIGGTALAPGTPVDLPGLARLLYFSAGVLRHKTYPGGEIFFRAAACTGALYHVDVYAACAPLGDLPAGVYHFGPHDFALRRLRAGDHRAALVAASGDEPALAQEPVILALTSTFWRNAWKYRSRTYRHCFWDAGTLLANLLAAAASVRIPARVVLGFADEPVNGLLDVDPKAEATIALVALGAGSDPPPAAPATPPLGFATLPLSPHPIDHPLVREAHAASSITTGDAARAWRASAQADSIMPVVFGTEQVPLTPLPPSAVPEPIEAVVLRRGSTRRFPRTSIPLDALATIVERVARPMPFDAAIRPDLYVIAHAVDGLAAGSYVAAPDGRALQQLAAGDFRATARHLDLGQDLAGDAAVNLYWLVDLEGVFARLGDRGYRAAQLAAAVAGGWAYLTAYALGLGATGLTFFDDDVTTFFSPHAAGKSVLFLVAVGRRPERRSPANAPER